jgi:hypothetical protein
VVGVHLRGQHGAASPRGRRCPPLLIWTPAAAASAPPSPPCSYATTRRSCAPSRRRSCWATLAAVSLLTELDAFYTDHRLCGELEASVEGPTVWFDCECGARIARRADDGDVLDLDG